MFWSVWAVAAMTLKHTAFNVSKLVLIAPSRQASAIAVTSRQQGLNDTPVQLLMQEPDISNVMTCAI
jgi:hypothetical protein